MLGIETSADDTCVAYVTFLVLPSLPFCIGLANASHSESSASMAHSSIESHLVLGSQSSSEPLFRGIASTDLLRETAFSLVNVEHMH